MATTTTTKFESLIKRARAVSNDQENTEVLFFLKANGEWDWQFFQWGMFFSGAKFSMNLSRGSGRSRELARVACSRALQALSFAAATCDITEWDGDDLPDVIIDTVAV